jgi:hypothetical protein
MIRTRILARFTEPFADLVRWGEPWDVEDEPDPLLGPAPRPELVGGTLTRRAS